MKIYCEICGELATRNIRWRGEDDYHLYCDKCVDAGQIEFEKRELAREMKRLGQPNENSDMREWVDW